MSEVAETNWTQPCCNKCWFDEYLDEGEFKRPPKLRVRELERCVYCNRTTRAGIYVRIDPAEQRFPQSDETRPKDEAWG